MRALWRRFKNGYLNLNLQTKFTIALISIVVIPACPVLPPFFFMDDFIAWWFPIPSGRNRTPPQKLHL